MPRTKLAMLASRDEASRTGVYVLAGPDPEHEGRERVYIGEADDIRTRLQTHSRDKEFWKRACLFSSTDENLTKAHARYLEARLIERAKLAARAHVDNGSAPKPPPLPESERSDMEFYLHNMEILLPALGFTFTQPSAVKALQPSALELDSIQRSPMFHLSVAEATARAVEINGEFVVLQGSTARREGVPSWTTGPARRDVLLAEGSMVPDENPVLFRFAEDIVMSSPSMAAAIVGGRNTNGRIAWKTESGTTYANWQEQITSPVTNASTPD